MALQVGLRHFDGFAGGGPPSCGTGTNSVYAPSASVVALE